MVATEYFTVGIVVGTHGIRGEVKVLSKTDFPKQRFGPKSKLWLRREGEQPVLQVQVRSARPHKNVWLVSFEGYSNINQVESWRGMQLCVPEDELMPLPEGTYYIHELVGLEVYTDDQRYVGKLVEVLIPGANDVYVVRGPLQQKDVLIPAIADVVQEVDLNAGRMIVHLLPGMLEEDEE